MLSNSYAPGFVVATVDKIGGKIVSGPDIVSRGFVYVRESEELMEESRILMKKAMEKNLHPNAREWNKLKGIMKDTLANFIFQKTRRSPMILPIILEV